jgi:tellurite resistance protein TerC
MRGSVNKTVRRAKRLVVGVVGSTVLLTGIAMLVLPGPALIVIPAGIAILATEFVWARKLLRKAKRRIGNLKAT